LSTVKAFPLHYGVEHPEEEKLTSFYTITGSISKVDVCTLLILTRLAKKNITNLAVNHTFATLKVS
jgi:hypothetical protein